MNGRLRGDSLLLDTVHKIFEQNIELLTQTEKAIIYLREQEYEKALSIVADTAEYINYVADAIIQHREYFDLVSVESIMEMLEGILDAKRQKDFVLLADLLELQLVNFICSVQELIMKKEDYLAFNELDFIKNSILMQEKILESDHTLTFFTEQDRKHQEQIITNEIKKDLDPAYLLEQGYAVEFSTCGLMTIGSKDENGTKFYMHTNHSVGKEAFLQARNWYCKDTETYIVYGYGMGYHIGELIKLAPRAQFEIYESDMNILKLSCAFSRITGLFEHENVKMYYDPDFIRIQNRVKEMGEGDKFCVHYPSFRNIKSKEAKDILLHYIPWAKKLEMC